MWYNRLVGATAPTNPEHKSESEMNEKDKIIERVQKLLAMAADESSPNEAAIAAKRARSLMDKYQISLGDMLRNSEFSQSKVGLSRKFMPIWENWLAIAVANYNDCIASLDMNDYKYKTVMFKGYDSDVKMCEYMYVFLVEACKRHCSMQVTGSRYNARVGTAYKEAFSGAVCDRLNDMTRNRKESMISDGRSLMVIKRDLVEQEFGKPGYKQYKHNVRNVADEMAARKMGMEAGRKVPLHMGVDETDKVESDE